MRIAPVVLAAIGLFIASAAHADLASGVRAALDAAIASGSDSDIDTVAKYLKQANPGDAAEIDKIIADHRTQIAAAKQEKLREQGLLQGWKGEGQIGIAQSSGNSDTFGVAAGLSLTKEGLRWRYGLRGQMNYERDNGQTSRNQMLFAFEPNYKFNDRLFAFGLGQYERDRFAGFTSRTTVSGGLGYKVVATPRLTVNVKAGPAWRETDLIGEPSTSELDALAALDAQWQISRALSLNENATVLYGSANTNLTSLTALSLKLNKALSARMSYQVGYNSDPPPSFKKTDTLTSFTLVYGF